MEMKREHIAPCGMNCRLCMAYTRDKKPCGGCRGDDATKPKHCVKCVIKNCEVLQQSASGMCFECSGYPCRRLKQLDARYTGNYGMSMLENQTDIKENGMDAFLQGEDARWRCESCGAVLTVHKVTCPGCGTHHGLWRRRF